MSNAEHAKQMKAISDQLTVLRGHMETLIMSRPPPGDYEAARECLALALRASDAIAGDALVDPQARSIHARWAASYRAAIRALGGAA